MRLVQCVGWLNEIHRVATRSDKLTTSFQPFLNLAIIRRYLRASCEDDGAIDRA